MHKIIPAPVAQYSSAFLLHSSATLHANDFVLERRRVSHSHLDAGENSGSGRRRQAFVRTTASLAASFILVWRNEM
jgi:hypothetical protein